LTMGDLVVNGHKKDLWPEHFNRFSNVMDHLWMVTARGNHEGSQILDPDNDWFAKYHELPAPGEPYCGMEWGNTWIGLISYEATVASPKWINEELPKVNKKYKILAHHFPVYCTGYFGPEDSRKEMGTTTYKPLADECDKFEIDIDVAGHTHIYERSHPIRNGQRDDVNGTVYVVNGGDINANYPEWFTAVADDRETFAKPTYTVFHMGEDQIWFRSFAWSKKEQKIVEIDYKIIPQLEDLPKQTLVKLQGASGDALLQTIQDLGAMTVHEAAEPLLAYLENPDQAVRAAATTALRRIGLPETSEKLLAYVRDENEQVRREAARAIEIAMPEGLAGAVAQVAADESADPNVRQALLGALQLHAPAGYATEQFLAVLKKADAPEPVRQRAAYALSRTATEKEVPVLMEMFKQEASQYVTVRLAFALNSLTGRRQPLDGKAPLAQSKPGEERQPFIDKWLDATEKKAA
ncbi:MAG: HEAT repeat domain-containing protein, partial [Candidatus Hydrogenedentes bacterium]|nr:HEAT repeat domain-containing protein [Candidatus Hydrogenedentota bacterium]